MRAVSSAVPYLCSFRLLRWLRRVRVAAAADGGEERVPA